MREVGGKEAGNERARPESKQPSGDVSERTNEGLTEGSRALTKQQQVTPHHRNTQSKAKQERKRLKIQLPIKS